MSFYERREWRDLRYRALRKYGFKCMACGAEKSEDVVIHVDHIDPISIYPERALDMDNLQVLCKDCNFGKSNIYRDDHRPKPIKTTRAQDETELSRLIETLRGELASAESGGNTAEQDRLLAVYLEVQRQIRSGADPRILLRRVVRAVTADQFKSESDGA